MRFQILVTALFLTLSPISGAGTAEARHMLFVGHSFFHPVASKMEQVAQMLGIEGHSQQVIDVGGQAGSPKQLWHGDNAAEIKRALDSGKVDLFGLTYHIEENSGYTDYQRWLDYLLKANPDASFLIGLPWGQFPAEKSLAEYVAENEQVEKLLKARIAELQTEYPDTEFILLNYGVAAIELRRMIEEGELPDIALIGDRKKAIYTDQRGHAGNALGELAVWLWVSALFEKSLLDDTKLDNRPMVEIAARIVQ